jgi:hypothetical protein
MTPALEQSVEAVAVYRAWEVSLATSIEVYNVLLCRPRNTIRNSLCSSLWQVWRDHKRASLQPREVNENSVWSKWWKVKPY